MTTATILAGIGRGRPYTWGDIWMLSPLAAVVIGAQAHKLIAWVRRKS